jgi:hypothetical protein
MPSIHHYKAFTISPILIDRRKWKPLIRNWRGAEPISDDRLVFNTAEEALAHARCRVDQYFLDNRGLV